MPSATTATNAPSWLLAYFAGDMPKRVDDGADVEAGKNEHQHRVTFQFGDSSLSMLGFFGAAVHVLIIASVGYYTTSDNPICQLCYCSWFVASSLVGVYSVPLLRRLRPRRRKTSMTHVIFNCTLLLVLSSAVPVATNTLGARAFVVQR